MCIHDKRIGAIEEKRKQEGEITPLLDIRAENERPFDLLIPFKDGLVVGVFGDPIDTINRTVVRIQGMNRQSRNDAPP